MEEDVGTQPISAGEYVLRETLEELEAAVRASRPCTYWHVTPLAARHHKTGFRQPIFSCRTCAAGNGGAPVGVCEPCMLSCHADHDVLEVGERHGFRCDCPTVRSTVACVAAKPGAEAAEPAGGAGSAGGESSGAGATANGLPHNEQNVYGHAFEGRFCKCDRPYDSARDTMHQCGACDEWYHDFHIPGCLPAGVIVESHICAACVARLPFLRAFAQYRRDVCSKRLSRVAPASASKAGGSAAKAGISAPALSEPVASSTAPSVSAEAASPATVVSPAPSEACAPGSALSTRSEEPSPPTMLQPWAACLTCSEGADDGRGVCMACAGACHAGHVLTEPRISEFFCDCAELTAGAGGCRCLEAPAPGAAPTAPAIRTCLVPTAAAATPVKPPTVGSAAPTYGGSEAGLRAWCAAIPVVDASLATVPNAAIFLSDDDDLLMQLCRCDACMSAYAAAGVIGWFEPEEEPETGHKPVAPATAAAGDAAGGADASAASAASGFGRAQMPAPLPPGFRTSYERAWEEFLKLPQTTQVDLLHGYNDLSAEFLEYLRGFATTGTVVTASHVREFFSTFMTSHRDKRRRAEEGNE